ncbi:MAG: hydrogenase maturation protease [Planctomycetota bacterium]|jgi:hydrogenase maturation protease
MERYIIGLGNYAKQDDGVGLRIIEQIIDNNLDDGFTAIEARNDGLSILNYFTDETVDCALVGLEPGHYMIFDIEDATSQKQVEGISTHEGDIMKIAEMGKKLGYTVPPIKVLAVQPDKLEMEMELSDTLNARLSEYVDAAVQEIKS